MHVELGRLRQTWGWNSPFLVETEKRDNTAKHIAIIASTGAGKSTHFRRIAHAEIHAGNGLILQDPHGDLFDWTLSIIPTHRANDVIVFAPTYESISFVPINPVFGSSTDKRIRDVLALAASLFEGGWGPQSDFISRNIGAAIAEVIHHPTLLHYDRAFMSRPFLLQLRAKAKSPRVRDFFSLMLEDWDKRQLASAAAPSTNKFNTFQQPILRHVTGVAKGLDFERILAEQKILLCRLPIGDIGEDIASMLAHLIQSETLLAGYARNRMTDRPHTAFLIDEAQKLARGHDQERFLNEMRKYNISLTTGFQAVAQIPPQSRSAVFNNVSALLVGTVGGEDSEILARELALPSPNTLLTTRPHYWWAKLKTDDIVNTPLLLEGSRPPERTGKEANPETITRRSNERYAIPRARIEAQIDRSMRSLEEATNEYRARPRNRARKAA
jgi:hypothetical protein